MPNTPCLLCELDSELQLSHVLPAFAYRWLKESSGSGHIRNSIEPNRRVQDGLKFHWLCKECEQLFSRSEGAFANELFHPYIIESGKTFQYSNWLMQFCTSVSWRVLRYYKDKKHPNYSSPDIEARFNEAEITWREYLLGKRPHPGSFEQHLLPLDKISDTSINLAPNINRYLMRAIQLDLLTSSNSIYTYAKLGRFIVIGFVHVPNRKQWKGTKVHAKSGIIGPRNYVLPRSFGNYLNDKANGLHQSYTNISETQQNKIDSAFRANIDEYSKSDAFDAMNADVTMFGQQAFSIKA